jgi:hypothetical protein
MVRMRFFACFNHFMLIEPLSVSQELFVEVHSNPETGQLTARYFRVQRSGIFAR